MIVWTIQSRHAWRELQATRHLRATPISIEPLFTSAYQWMIQQMTQRIGPPPSSETFPLWAWYQWKSSGQRQPDVRATGHLPKGTYAVRLTCELDDSRVLLSDFDGWHYVLNNWYLPQSEQDAMLFDQVVDSDTKFIATPMQSYPCYVRSQVIRSWERIFDLDWIDSYVTQPKEQKAIQATFWELHDEDVLAVKEFVAR